MRTRKGGFTAPINDSAFPAGHEYMTLHYSRLIATKMADKRFSQDFVDFVGSEAADDLKAAVKQVEKAVPCCVVGTEGEKPPPTLNVKELPKDFKKTVSGMAKVLFREHFTNAMPFDHNNEPSSEASQRIRKIVFRITGVTEDFPSMCGEDEGRTPERDNLEADKYTKIVDLAPSHPHAIFLLKLIEHAETMTPGKQEQFRYHVTLNAMTTHVMLHADVPYADGPGGAVINFCSGLGGLLAFVKRHEQLFRTMWIRDGDCYSFSDSLRYEYLHAVLLANPSLAEVSAATNTREDMRYVFTIRVQQPPEDVLSNFKDYWQSSDNDSDSSGQQRRSSRHKNNTVW